MKFEQPPLTPSQEPGAPESEPQAIEETKDKKIEESKTDDLERFENETDREYRRRMLDMSNEIEERLARSGEWTEEDTELLKKNDALIARAKEVNEKMLNERREKVAIEGKKQIPQALYEGFIRMATIAGSSREEAEKRISEFHEPIPEKIQTEDAGNEKDIWNEATDTEATENYLARSEKLVSILRKALDTLRKRTLR
jgi:hypothetical protein